ncbi:hypothetical protein COLO4_13365 [Corchorus olitorius]|uniref:Coiled-coil domain-containing protein 86 n=1 Tax=Corchorus olitorius TaxID=93759 RepID=A0A1R3JWP3_9ROSI|nr:hypothetical protein COLO4_13365 [Corchorus olitorius]
MACTIDFRRLDEGFGGKTYKRKRQEKESAVEAAISNDASTAATSMDVDDSCPPPAKRSAVPSTEDPNKPTFGQPTYDGVIAGRVSGRNWKQPRKHRASAKHLKTAANRITEQTEDVWASDSVLFDKTQAKNEANRAQHATRTNADHIQSYLRHSQGTWPPHCR